jgi:hypothetical protein
VKTFPTLEKVSSRFGFSIETPSSSGVMENLAPYVVVTRSFLENNYSTVLHWENGQNRPNNGGISIPGAASPSSPVNKFFAPRHQFCILLEQGESGSMRCFSEFKPLLERPLP